MEGNVSTITLIHTLSKKIYAFLFELNMIVMEAIASNERESTVVVSIDKLHAQNYYLE